MGVKEGQNFALTNENGEMVYKGGLENNDKSGKGRNFATIDHKIHFLACEEQ